MHRLVLVAVLVASPALAEHVISVGGFANLTTGSFNSGPGQAGPFVMWQWTSKSHFGLGAGLRVTGPSAIAPVPLEGFFRGHVTTAIGPWEPLLGPELGVSGLGGFAQPFINRPRDFFEAESRLTGSFYVSFHTELLRFRFGRFLVSAGGFDVGTSLTAAGTTLRLQLDVATLGVRL